jgi:tetratricopeptide (TPR) repeat protein
MRSTTAALLACALALTAALQAQGTTAQAKAALEAGEADRALGLLNSLPATAETHNLRCRVLLTLERWDAAANECEQAVHMDGGNSNFHLWLGRALGERADRASFMSAYGLGKRVRQEFEKAVELDPRNADALADLGEFYNSAPGVVGGGADKAENVASQLDRVEAARAHQLRGWTAESRKDYGTAERELRAAVAVDPHPAFAWMSVASFYRRRQRWSDLDAALASGIKAAQHDRQAGVALYNGSSVLTKANRNLPMATKMLEDYLASSSKTEEAPAFTAYTRLAKLKAQAGDRAGAAQARQAALSLAHDYKPALDLKF